MAEHDRQMTFDFGQAEAYMESTLKFEKEMDELRTRIAECDAEAKALGVPTKAVKLAVKEARNRAKAHDIVAPEDYAKLVAMATAMVLIDEATEGLGDLEDVGQDKGYE